MIPDGDEMQLGVDMYDAEEERRLQHEEAYRLRLNRAGVDTTVRDEALALIAAHPHAYRVGFADRLLAMDEEQLASYLTLRRDAARMLERDRARSWKERDWTDHEALPPRGVKGRRDIPEPSDARPGQDALLVLGDVDHPRRDPDGVPWYAA